MQKPSGAAACASCKHQRKKCTDKCVLAPYFPAENIREFKAVHKVFGVSNITKIVKNLKEDHDRRRAVESLIWEAFCRQKDPILGPYGEYKRVYEELKLYKSQYNQILQGSNNNNTNNNVVGGGMVYDSTTTTTQGLINGWNINTKLINHENSTVESWSSYNNKIINPLHHHHHHVQNIEKLRTENSNGSIVIMPQQQAYNEFNQQYFLAGQYNPIDSKPRESMMWEDNS